MSLQRLRLLILVAKSLKLSHIPATHVGCCDGLSTNFRQSRRHLSISYRLAASTDNVTTGEQEVSSKSNDAPFSPTTDQDLEQSSVDNGNANAEKIDDLKHPVSENQVTGSSQEDKVVDIKLAKIKSILKNDAPIDAAGNVDDETIWIRQLEEQMKDLVYRRRRPKKPKSPRNYFYGEKSKKLYGFSPWISATWCAMRWDMFKCLDIEVLESASHVTSTGFYVSLRLLQPETTDEDIRQFLWPLEVGTISRQNVRYKTYAPKVIAYVDLNSESDVEFATLRTNLCIGSLRSKVLVVRHFQPYYPPECYLKVYHIPRLAKLFHVAQIFYRWNPKRVILLYSPDILQNTKSAIIEFDNEEAAGSAFQYHFPTNNLHSVRVERLEKFQVDIQSVSYRQRFDKRVGWSYVQSLTQL